MTNGPENPVYPEALLPPEEACELFFDYLALVPRNEQKIVQGVPTTIGMPHRNAIHTEIALPGVRRGIARMNIQPSGKLYLDNGLTREFGAGLPDDERLTTGPEIFLYLFGLSGSEVLRLFTGTNSLEAELKMYREMAAMALDVKEIVANMTIYRDTDEIPIDMKERIDAARERREQMDPERDVQTRFTMDEIRELTRAMKLGPQYLRAWRAELIATYGIEP